MEFANFDATDIAILRTLQREGRLTIQELSDRVALSPSPCGRRLKMLEASGVITGYSALIDESRLGFTFSAFLSIKLERQVDAALREFEDAIAAFPEVVDAWLMTGPRDYLLRVVTEDLGSFEHFITRKLTLVPSVSSIESSIPLRRAKSGTARTF